ncbi:MAG: helix-turn-helix domain-containing protein [Pseudomonadota bacterium]
MNQKEEKKDKIEPQGLCGVGAYLKGERENRSLTHDQVTRITRLRPRILKALENEDWENLPQTVFVRGFIKSYAQALGLDERKALKLYEALAVVEPAPLRPLGTDKRNQKARLLLLFILLGFMVTLGYHFKDHLLPKKPTIQIKDVVILKKAPEGNKHEEPEHPQKAFLSSTTPHAYSPLSEETKTSDSAAQPETKQILSIDLPPLVLASDQPETREWHVLKCFVKARTWVRIHVDGQGPKEFIFEPGSKPQWRAREGFSLIIGNAGGVEFDFDGEQILNLGKAGQVVRLSLPKNYRVTVSED